MINKVIKIGKFILIGIIIILILAIGDIAFSVFYLNKNIVITHYNITSKLANDFRIVQLTDLHSKQFGKNNDKIIRCVKENQPDIIVMTGDMVDRDDEDPAPVIQLIEDLLDIAPVYFSYGNHEYKWEKKWNKQLTPLIEQTGAEVLKHEYVDIDIKGNRIRLGGYYGYYRRPHMVNGDVDYSKMEMAFCDSFEDTADYKILLSHIPTMWLDWDCLSDYPVDMVLCGHYHGGIVRIPFIDRGIVAPYVGWLPKYTRGIYIGEETTCILSTGLGDEYKVPRINNPPEIVVVDCEKE